MMESKKLLENSFKMLLKDPKLFSPKIITSLISSTWIVLFFNSSIPLQYFIITLPMILLLGLLTPLFLVDLIQDYPNYKFQKSFKSLLASWKNISLFILFLLLSSLIINLPIGIGILIYLTYNTIAPLLFLIFISGVGMLLFGFSSYFMPVTILEESTAMESVSSSVETSIEYKKEVSFLIAVSGVLLIVGILSQSILEEITYIGFIISRLITAIISTYIFTLIPKFYNKKKLVG